MSGVRDERFRFSLSPGTPSETTITTDLDVMSNEDIYKIGLAFLTGDKSQFKHLDAPTNTQIADADIFKYRIAFRLLQIASQSGDYGPPVPEAAEKAKEAYLELQKAQILRIEYLLDQMASSEVKSKRKKMPKNAVVLRQKLFDVEVAIAKLSEELEFETYGQKKLFKFREARSELITRFDTLPSGSLIRLRKVREIEKKEKEKEEEQKPSSKVKQIYAQLQILSEQKDQLSKLFREAFHKKVQIEGGLFDRPRPKKMVRRQHAFDPMHSSEPEPESPLTPPATPLDPISIQDTPLSDPNQTSPISPSGITFSSKRKDG